MKTSQSGLDFITANEGCILSAYKDAVGVWTIGVGHTGPEVHEGLLWTPEQAQQALEKDVAKVEMTLNALAPDTCTQNQFDALVDFGFNLGTGALQTLLSHGWREVPNQLYWEEPDGTVHGWIHAGGKILPGLVKRRNKRRKKEQDLFNTP